MKKYRIKPQGIDDEIGTILIDYQGKNLVKLNHCPTQLFVAELIEDTDQLQNIKNVFPDSIDVSNLPE